MENLSRVFQKQTYEQKKTIHEEIKFHNLVQE